MIRLLLLLFPLQAFALSPAAQEFMQISKELETVQCEKRQLRRKMALAEAEQRDADVKAARARFAQLNKDPKNAKLEKRLAELEPRLRNSSDPDDLPAISLQQREAFYRCDYSAVTNPYRAPGAVVADQDRPVGSPVKAVIFGVLVDILGTTAASFIVMVVYGIFLASRGTDPQEIERVATQLDPLSGLGLFMSAIGCVFSFLGGYVCARVAGQAEMKWAGVVAAISLAFGVIVGLQAYSLGMNLLLAAPATAFVLIGGYAGARRNRRP